MGMFTGQLRNEPFFLPGRDPNRACLMLHGLGAGTYELQILAEHLHQQGNTLKAILYPGHDQPQANMPNSTWQQWYKAVERAYLELKATYSEVDVIGFSTGCPLGLYLASQHPIRKLVCLCPYLSLKQPWYSPVPLESLIKSVGLFLPQVPRLDLPFRDPTLKAQVNRVKFYRTFNLVAVRSAMELIETVKPLIPEITVPTLIIQARHDTIVNPEGAVYLYEALGSGIKKLAWCENSDHIITLDYDRDQVAAEVTAFLN
ncbi:alpha/beta hydrolase [Thermosynechococcaceae cyanobacterium BACA0444]|uniref:Alpha/beta hydrolase n=1 Tax=Pseudocalidococcus azoricus BACA0444 TaxID=2918990 RepID=A0AAE4JYC8_9CYAN|nr:alpha/beta fold hydrolase [Pseudocalidococcus azoricus]MDS3862048.1 alpha/beta hydrolase [Pseudocalidococcus azoricus BACA0444]